MPTKYQDVPPVQEGLNARFIDAPVSARESDSPDVWNTLANRASCRRFSDKQVDRQLLDTLCALALSSPSKSDLQQRDLVVLSDPQLRKDITESLPGSDWMQSAPVFIVFCGNNRRHRQLFEWRDQPFLNDHLDPFFNAAVDAGIALSAMVIAAEAAGLGCCPVSVIRNESQKISELLRLPDYVFPVAGLAIGWPLASNQISRRLPLTATVHHNRFDDTDVKSQIAAYDADRSQRQPFGKQRDVERFGTADTYGWSEDKFRQYSVPERPDFGAYIRARGFRLE